MATKKIDWGTGWHWPVPDLRSAADERLLWPARISQEFRAGNHAGVDIMYRRAGVVDLERWPVGRDDAGAKQPAGWFAPAGTPVLAAREGKVWEVRRGAVGWMVVLDHGPPWATMYLHLESVVDGLVKGQAVTAGQRIGVMGFNPNVDPWAGVVDADKVRHLHFECWYKGGSSSAVDPSSVMSGWARSSWTL